MIVGSFPLGEVDEVFAFVYYSPPNKISDLFSVETKWLAEMVACQRCFGQRCFGAF